MLLNCQSYKTDNLKAQYTASYKIMALWIYSKLAVDSSLWWHVSVQGTYLLLVWNLQALCYHQELSSLGYHWLQNRIEHWPQIHSALQPPEKYMKVWVL